MLEVLPGSQLAIRLSELVGSGCSQVVSASLARWSDSWVRHVWLEPDGHPTCTEKSGHLLYRSRQYRLNA